MSRPLAERLWEKVIKLGPDECWLFTGSLNEHGYGSLWDNDNKRLIKAHKAAYIITYGETDLTVFRHNCDNPPCCNPAHITPGTMKDNSQDMVRRGRHKAYFNKNIRGEKHPSTKILDSTKQAIRLDTRSHRVIAADYGISKSHITRIKTQKETGNGAG